MQVGIIGAGYVSAYHIRAIRTNAQRVIVGIADADIEKAREMARRFAIPHAVRSLSELAALKPQVIHILTPPSSHCSLALEALDMGCHVLVEKPMALSVEECDQMIGRAKEKGLVLSVNHSMSFDPMMPKARRLIEHGRIGDVLTVDYFRSSDYPGWAGGSTPAYYRDGGYPYRDLGIHGLYLLENFLGPAQRVQADYRTTGRDPNLMFDEWRALAWCARGVGHIQLSWNTRPMLNELLIQGTRGTIRVDFSLQTLTVRGTIPGPKIGQLVWGAISTGIRQVTGTVSTVLRFATKRLVPSPSIHFAVIAFHEALGRNAPPPVTPEEGRRIVGFVEEAAGKADADRQAFRDSQSPQKPARVLLTGAGGFLGSAVRRRLEESGETVRMMVHRPRTASLPQNLEMVAGDLGDKAFVDQAVAGCEVVYHVGAAMRGSSEDFQRGTIAGTRNVIEACLRHGVRRLVYVSSLSVLDHAGHFHGQPLTETALLEPKAQLRGAYTQTKLEAERLVLAAARERGLPAVILRPGQIFGPGAEQTAPSGTIGIAGRWIVAGSGKRKLPLVYVDDVADALLQAASAEGAIGNIYHLVDPEPVTQRDYIEFARKKLGARLKSSFTPLWFLRVLAIGVEFLGKLLKRSAPLTRYRLDSLRPLYPFDCSAAAKDLGWKPKVGTREGLRRTFG